MKGGSVTDYLVSKLWARHGGISDEIIETAREMERLNSIRDYNAGYEDASVNHINDAENYVNDINYINKNYD
jgi:hypothetical protein